MISIGKLGFIHNEFTDSGLLLCFTGQSRESAHIIAEQSNNISNGTSEALAAMHGMKQEALNMKECLLKGDFLGLVESMQKGWIDKKRSAKAVSNPFMNEMYDAAIRAGALAGKVSGAGGGGFMLFFVPAELRMNVIRTLQKFNTQVSNCHFTQQGAQAWRIL